MTNLYTIPVPVGVIQYDLFVVLSEGNIERIKERDPAEVVTQQLLEAQGWHPTMMVRNVIITYATPEEIQQVTAMLIDGKCREALRFLTRGYRFRPELGDSDAPSALA